MNLDDVTDVQSLVRAFVTDVCDPETFGRMSLRDKQNFQMLVVFKFLLEKGYSHGINALIPAKKTCKQTQVGVGWRQIPKTRMAIVRAYRHSGLPFSDRQETYALLAAATLVIEELIRVNESGGISN